MARPRLQLDERQIETLAGINCSLPEIAAVMNCDVKTLTNRYSLVIEKGRLNGRSSLKKKQFEVAMKGNVTMLIWLGKITLGQRDVVEYKQEQNIKVSAQEQATILAQAQALATKLDRPPERPRQDFTQHPTESHQSLL